MSEDLVVSIFDENNDVEEDNVLMGKVIFIHSLLGCFHTKIFLFLWRRNQKTSYIWLSIMNGSPSWASFTFRLFYPYWKLPALLKQGDLFLSHLPIHNGLILSLLLSFNFAKKHTFPSTLNWSYNYCYHFLLTTSTTRWYRLKGRTLRKSADGDAPRFKFLSKWKPHHQDEKSVLLKWKYHHKVQKDDISLLFSMQSASFNPLGVWLS